MFALQACGPLWSYECGSSYYSTGICSRVNASFKFSRTIAPAFQSKLYLLSLKKIYGKCEVTAEHYFLIWKHLLSPSVLFIFKHFTGCETYMDIVIVLDGSNSIYPWYEVQAFLINILQKFYIGPGQIQVCCGSSLTVTFILNFSVPVVITKGFGGSLDRSECFSTVRRWSMSSNWVTTNLLRKLWNEHAVSTSEAARRQTQHWASTWRGMDRRCAPSAVIPVSGFSELVCCAFAALKPSNTEVAVVPKRWW